MARGLGTCALALAAATAAVSVAHAGGFGRGTADTDILFEEGNFNMRAGVTIVAPQRGYETINGDPATDGNFLKTHAIPSYAAKINLHDQARCAGTFVEVYGANVEFGPQAQAADARPFDFGGVIGVQPTDNATSEIDLAVAEVGLTCAAGMDLGPGKAWVLGGVFLEEFTYTEVTATGILSFDGDYTPGFRVGAAYEVPEIALRAQLMYRSGVKHMPGGGFVTVTGVPNTIRPGSYAAVGEGQTPQSLELSVRSGIAAGTIVFGSVKWTDWSVVDTLDFTIDPGVTGFEDQNEYFWKDGWTLSAGVGRQITESIAASASLTWDQGVSTTEDLLTDTWTLGGGVSMTGNRSRLQLGGAVSLLTAGSQSGIPTGIADPGPPPVPISADGPGADFNATVGTDWAFALGGSFTVNW